MTRTILTELSDGPALDALIALAAVMADIELCAHPSSPSGEGHATNAPESSAPRGDMNAIRLLATTVKAIEGEVTIARDRLNRIVRRQTAERTTEVESIGGHPTDLPCEPQPVKKFIRTTSDDVRKTRLVAKMGVAE